jgi:hypothetical protein
VGAETRDVPQGCNLPRRWRRDSGDRSRLVGWKSTARSDDGGAPRGPGACGEEERREDQRSEPTTDDVPGAEQGHGHPPREVNAIADPPGPAPTRSPFHAGTRQALNRTRHFPSPGEWRRGESAAELSLRASGSAPASGASATAAASAAAPAAAPVCGSGSSCDSGCGCGSRCGSRRGLPGSHGPELRTLTHRAR